ncbi:MAG: preprotein translocase subunit SecG [Oscillospiraceae bacterium]|nr:preprotein translocase subunit SecG [Oscillospiraceae bacterium]
MGLFEIISGILLLISGIIIIVSVILQESKQQGMSSAITGGGSDSYFGKNKPKTREASLARITKIVSVIFFVLTIAVSIGYRIFRVTDGGGGEEANVTAFLLNAFYGG